MNLMHAYILLLPSTTHERVWQAVQDSSVFAHIHKQHCVDQEAAAGSEAMSH